ncbi:1-Cys peroxiredoxin, partial [Piptocephalis cylindrospora]
MSSSLRLGSVAPDFTTETTHGFLRFHQWLGSSWGLLFSHPADFTPVCTSEFGFAANLAPAFKARNVKVIGLSVDDIEDHHDWISDIEEISKAFLSFPIIADKDRAVSRLYGMLDSADHDPDNIGAAGLPMTVRSVFIIDPEKRIRLILTYPASCGRNFDEIIRVIDSLQLTDAHHVCTPANWKPGEK